MVTDTAGLQRVGGPGPRVGGWGRRRRGRSSRGQAWVAAGEQKQGRGPRGKGSWLAGLGDAGGGPACRHHLLHHPG